jgi:antirestriction protein ArdC
VIFLALDTPGLADGQGCSAVLHPDPKGEPTMKTQTTLKTDIYTRVTNNILADLEQGVRTWQKPWHPGHAAGHILRPLRANGLPYRGINILLLWSSALEQGFTSPFWLTFKQADALGAHVRKGEKGSLVVYADTFHKTETDENSGEEVEKDIPFMKAYTVFNANQIEGLPEHYTPALPEQPEAPVEDRNEVLDWFFASTGIMIRQGGDRAFYAIGSDHVQMPPFPAFRDAESYYATLAHEITHATRHPSRLDRDSGRKQWGDEGYAKEELVAELGAAFLCAELGITPEIREDHAAYIASWLKALQDDKRFIFSAAAHAQRAVDYLTRTHRQDEAEAMAA